MVLGITILRSRLWSAIYDVIPQRARHSSHLGVQVVHRRFEMRVPEDDLQVPDKGSVLKRVRRERVAQVVRGQAAQAAAIRSSPDGSLDVGLMTAPTHKLVGPPLRVLGVWVFLGQEPWKGNGNAFGHVVCGQRFGQYQLPVQGGAETFGKDDDPTFVAFGLVEVEPSAAQVEVLDSQVERLAHAQPAGVDQVNDQPRRVAVGVRYLGQEAEHFITSRAMAQSGWPFRPKRVHVSELLFERMAVEEEQGAEGLVLGGGGHALQGQAGEESFDLLLSRNQRLGFWSFKEGGILAHPVNIGFFSAEGGVLKSTSFSEGMDCVNDLHFR